MKKWDDIKKEIKLKESFKEIMEYKNYTIYDVEHSIARYKERIDKDITNYISLLKKSVDWIIKNKKENIEDRYIFLSFKHGFGIQLEWRKDKYNNSFNGYTATTFSKEEMKFVKYKDKQVFIENLHKVQGYSLFESVEIIKKGSVRFQFNENMQKEMNLCGFNFFIEDQKLYYTFTLVEI